jgi:hypothetical protein
MLAQPGQFDCQHDARGARPDNADPATFGWVGLLSFEVADQRTTGLPGSKGRLTDSTFGISCTNTINSGLGAFKNGKLQPIYHIDRDELTVYGGCRTSPFPTW